MKTRSYSDEQFIKAVKENTCIKFVLKALGLVERGNNYNTVKSLVKQFNLDTSHWLDYSLNSPLKGTKCFNGVYKNTLSEVLVENCNYNTGSLKKRLIKEKIFEAKCYNCNNIEWLGKPIPLELEHINGIHTDNKIENLTILCPNCHAFTPTYRGRKNRLKRKPCKVCKNPVETLDNDFYCSNSCSVRDRDNRKFEISKEELEKLIKEIPMTKIGKMFGVSDNAVKKRAKLLGIELQDRRGYWMKMKANEKFLCLE